MSDEKIHLTADQAIKMLALGPTVHNFVNPVGILVGCDFDRADAESALREAFRIEIGGEACMAMKHPIVCWRDKKDYSFFEADMSAVEKFLAERAS